MLAILNPAHGSIGEGPAGRRRISSAGCRQRPGDKRRSCQHATSRQTRDDHGGDEGHGDCDGDGKCLAAPSRDLLTTIATTTANNLAAGDAAVGAGGSWRCE